MAQLIELASRWELRFRSGARGARGTEGSKHPGLEMRREIGGLAPGRPAGPSWQTARDPQLHVAPRRVHRVSISGRRFGFSSPEGSTWVRSHGAIMCGTAGPRRAPRWLKACRPWQRRASRDHAAERAQSTRVCQWQGKHCRQCTCGIS